NCFDMQPVVRRRRWLNDVNEGKDRLSAGLIEAVKTCLGTTPDHACVIFINSADGLNCRVVTGLIDEESVRNACGTRPVPIRQRIRYEPAKAPVSRRPVDPGSRFEEITDLAAGKTLIRPVIGKLVTVKSGQPFASAKPQEALGVLHDAIDV